MSDFERSTEVSAPAESVFDWVSDLANLPRFLPALERVERGVGNRVRVRGVAHGHRFDAAGDFNADPTRLRMWWSAEGSLGYRGWLQVEPAGDHTDVTVHLHYAPGGVAADKPVARLAADREIEMRLVRSLNLLRAQLEEEIGELRRPWVSARTPDHPLPPLV